MKETRVGISGWTYAPWRKIFYPKGLPRAQELEYASRQFNTIEINGSFYALQRPESYLKWYRATPDDFIFSVKATRFITHVRRLREVDGALANFLASGLLLLQEKLGPILWQFPPSMKYDPELFEKFFKLLPHDTESAEKIAERHDSWMRGRTVTRTDRKRKLRHVIEVRHPSFNDPTFIDLLRRHRLALVFSDSSGAWPYFEDVTSDFVYLRLHGEGELYSGEYGDAALNRWAQKIRLWRSGKEPRDAQRISPVRMVGRARDAYVYFDNDVKVRAPFDAKELQDRLSGRYRGKSMTKHVRVDSGSR